MPVFIRVGEMVRDTSGISVSYVLRFPVPDVLQERYANASCVSLATQSQDDEQRLLQQGAYLEERRIFSSSSGVTLDALKKLLVDDYAARLQLVSQSFEVPDIAGLSWDGQAWSDVAGVAVIVAETMGVVGGGN